MRVSNILNGILLVDKAPQSTSFYLVSLLRRLTGIEKIGHAGTLDPFATGVMVMLIGKEMTRRSHEFLSSDKEYRATIQLGLTTETYDLEGAIVERSDKVPTLAEVELALSAFQGDILQTPPMYSAKKVGGKKLYDLARRGIVIERQPVLVRVAIELLQYNYPMVDIKVTCSKGTYIRSLAHDLGQGLGCGAHLFELTRTRSGCFRLEDCVPQALLKDREFDITPHLRRL
ncbi:MAG: tRNA pseudouridine(55) synthase TruB [Verrucomicrobia bacterium]|nr:tRNA pseudouridine(55) synthase TruB [Verrucomicrobiota bacterium]MDE3048239.1 tRNA pseudouridine(55) synthase TruB [Verrucomicrobiota bacterium]